MDSIFQGVPNVCVYSDNLYITGKNNAEHLQTLNRVLKMASERGLKINKEKCQFMLNEIKFLGYRLSREGLRPQNEKTNAIKNAPKPENMQQLRAFLGLINYYGKFIGNLSNTLSPLYRLLQKNVPWHWGKKQDECFQAAKDILSSETLLVHYDPEKSLVLICDASPDGVGTVLAHQDEHGERPIAFASRSLNKAEKNYSQLDREGLALIFGVKKFHKFLYGRHFTMVTDHKPLLGLFGEHKSLPEHASPRVQRWAITLTAYDYQLKYRPGTENSADALSRLPLKGKTQNSDYIPEEIEMLFNVIENSSVNANDVAIETNKDECLRRVYEYCLYGWPDGEMHEDLKPYKHRHLELSLENGCILWGSRVIIPKTLQNEILTMLHDTHVGSSRMKSLARSWFWWPHLDADIEKFVKLCGTCAKHSKQPAKAMLHNWDWPTEPWKRIHIDYAGPFLNKMFLIVIDAHSKWLEVKIMNTITTADTIIELKDIFSYHGLPDQIVSDNGPSFTSHEFKLFCAANGIKHTTTSPYHPASNGLAEKAVGTFKSSIIKMGNKFSLRERVNRFVTKYRVTPHVTTGLAPCELLCGRKLKTHLDLLHPTVQHSVFQHQRSQKFNHDKTAREREIRVDDNVYVKNFGKGEKWLRGQIVECTGPVSYKIRMGQGTLVRRHADQIKITCAEDDHESITPTLDDWSRPNELSVPKPMNKQSVSVRAELDKPISVSAELDKPNTKTNEHKESDNKNQSTTFNQNSSNNRSPSREGMPTQQSLRRSTRTIKAPDKLNL